MRRSAWMVACVLVVGVPDARAERDVLASTDARLCRDESPVVGYRRCVPYASWSRRGPNVFIEIGMVARHIASAPALAVSARRVGAPEPTPSATFEAHDVLSFVERVGVHVASPLFVGAEVEFGAGISADDMTGRRAVLVGGSGVVGLRGSVPYGALGLDLVAGGRIIDDTSFIVQTRNEGVVEVRARAAVTFSPWLGLGVAVGKSLLHRDDWVVGLVLAAETYAFGGGR